MKIIRVGNPSIAACILKDFLREHGIRLRDEVVLVWYGYLKVSSAREKVTGFRQKVNERIK